VHIVKGSTYRDTLRWATSECRLRQVAITPAAPMRFTVVAHGLPDGWSVQVEGSQDFDPRERHRIVVVDVDTIELPCVNGAAFRSKTAVLRWSVPVDLAGYTARMQIRDKVGGTVLLDSATGDIALTIDNATKTVDRSIAASVTAALTWKKGVYDLELVSGDYVVKLDSGAVTVGDEVTT
jgi:hypothetical protein